MINKPQKWHSLFDKIPGKVYLLLATLIFGVSSPVTRKLTEIGAQHLRENRNPISLCNVLFVGNLCALIVLLIIYWQQWNKANLQQLSKQNWFYLTIVAILSGALAPSLFFQALALTNVNNVVLVGRLEPPLTLALSVWYLKERVTRWQVTGAFLAFVGIALTIILQPPEKAMMNMGGFAIGLGEILTVIASIAVSVATIITKQNLSPIPVGIYSIFRTALGTVIFFFIALTLYGQQHFIDVFSPFLWQWMLLYSAIIVVLGQLFWLKGFQTSSVATTTLVSSVTPLISILGAYLILGEIPTQAQYIGGSLVLVGIFLSQIQTKRQINELTSKMSLTQIEQKMDEGMGFKGF